MPLDPSSHKDEYDDPKSFPTLSLSFLFLYRSQLFTQAFLSSVSYQSLFAMSDADDTDIIARILSFTDGIHALLAVIRNNDPSITTLALSDSHISEANIFVALPQHSKTIPWCNTLGVMVS